MEQNNSLKDSFFDTSNVMSALKNKALRGGILTLSARISGQMVRLISIVILARLLKPEDFGLFAMIATITGFLMLFSDLGLSHATIQRAQIDHRQISNLFWVNSGVGLLAAVLTILIAPAIAWFYGEGRLLWPAITLSAGFIFAGLTVQHQALLQRQLRFSVLAIVNITGCILGVITAVVSALLGAKIWALVLMPLSDGVFRMAAIWFFCPWRPGRPCRRSKVGGMLRFGGNLTGFNVVNYFSRHMDHVLIGWYWGAATLGLYNRAYALLLLPIRQISMPLSTVAIPTLSRLQNDPERYRRYYLKAVSLIARFTIPVIIFLIVMSGEVIQLVLGEKWAGAGRIFGVLGISALIQPVLNTTGWLFVSSGRTDRMFRWGIVSSICIILSFVIGLPYGVVGIAWAYTVCILLLAIPALWYSSLGTSVSLSDIFNVMRAPLTAIIPSAMLLIYSRSLLPEFCAGIVGLGSALAGTIVIYWISYCLLVRNLSPISEVFELLSSAIKPISIQRKEAKCI